MLFILLLNILLLAFIIIFWQSQFDKDVRNKCRKTMYPPSRESYKMKKPKNTTQYERAPQNPQNFSQPYDGKFNQYDFKLPFVNHNSSLIPESSSSHLKNPQIQQFNEPHSESTLINNHRFSYEDKSARTNSFNTKSQSIPNQSISNSSRAYYSNRSPTSISQICNLATNPPVLPAVIKNTKTTSAPQSQQSSAPSTFNMPSAPRTSSSGSAALPTPPASSTGGSAASAINFNFTFPAKK